MTIVCINKPNTLDLRSYLEGTRCPFDPKVFDDDNTITILQKIAKSVVYAPLLEVVFGRVRTYQARDLMGAVRTNPKATVIVNIRRSTPWAAGISRHMIFPTVQKTIQTMVIPENEEKPKLHSTGHSPSTHRLIGKIIPPHCGTQTLTPWTRTHPWIFAIFKDIFSFEFFLAKTLVLHEFE